MKAVIMAGGEGSRLRPLTCDLPKPMARLLGKPVLEYILDLLSRYRFTHAALTLRYLPDSIIGHFPDAYYKGIALDFAEENEPLGTAGSVRNACRDSDSEILVISGDALCDFDLTAAMRFHRETGADVTIIANKVDDPREYGLIDTRENGRINAFIEKPAYSQAISDLANTGIYILSRRALDLIPADRAYDFAKDLFPLMLEKGMDMRCWEGSGYWCDIGDLESYIRCQRDMLYGRVDCEIAGMRDENGNIFADEAPQGEYVIEAPVYIGRNTRIEDGAHIECGCVVDDGCFIDKNARVTGSVLLQNSHIARRARLTGALVCAGATVKPGAMLFEGSAIGAGAVVGEKATVNAGVKVWNKKIIQPSVIVAEHVKTGSGASGFFDDDGITGDIGVELTPEFAARVGCAVGSLNPGARIGVGYSNQQSAEVLAAAVASGVQCTGASVLDFGRNFQAQFEYSMNFCSLPLGIFVKGDNRAALRVMSAGGIPANREIERGIEGVLSRGEFKRAAWDAMGDRVEMSGMVTLYKSQLLRHAPRGLSGCAVSLRSSNLAVQSTLNDVLYKLGCDTSTGFTLELSSQGDRMRIFDPVFGYIPHYKIFAWCAISEMERGDIAVPFDSPRVLDDFAKKYGRRVLRYYNCPADNSDAEARYMAKLQMWSRDALMQSVMFLSLVKKRGGLGELVDRLPGFDREERTIETNGNPAGFIRSINTEKTGRITEGILLSGSKGIVLVKPLKRGTGVKIMAEAASSEIASELCADVEAMFGDRDGGLNDPRR